MQKMTVAEARRAEAAGKNVRLQGWVRTRRDSKGGFSFLELNDGSCFGNVQVVAEAALPNYETRDQAAHGRLQRHGRGRGQGVAGQGPGDRSPGRRESRSTAGPIPRPIRCRRKRHSFEFLRTIAHLRPRTNTFGAIARVRNCVCRSIHDFFQEEGFLYVHTPIITASDCEGAGEMFQVTTLDLAKVPKTGPASRLRAGLLRPAGVPHRQRPARGRDLRLRAGQGLHLRPDVPRGELEHVAAPGRVLDGRAGDGLLRPRPTTWTWPRRS